MSMNTRNLRFRSNRIRDILGLFHEELDPLYGSGEVAAFCEILCEAFLGWDRVRLLTEKEKTIDQSDLLRFHWALEALHRHRPTQHIVGYTDFCGCRIEVCPDVLIPRPETEEMVRWITGGNLPEAGSILDLCTGSGCIAIALKQAFPRAEVTAVDVSDRALAVAQRNATANGTEVEFQHADVLYARFGEEFGRYSLIVSNPPYVRECEKARMSANVLDYDPALALFVPDDDPLRFYRAIGIFAQEHLGENGLLALEINEALGDETCELLHRTGFSPTLHTDFRGRKRWVSAHKD